MRVALDARTLQFAVRGGIGRSYANLIPLIERDVQLHLLTDKRLPPLLSHLPQTQLRTPIRGASLSWLQLSAPMWLRSFDGVFHCPFYALPVIPLMSCARGVVGMHDLTFEHHPEWFPRGRGPTFRLQARRAIATASAVLTPSQFVRDDVVNFYGIDPTKVVVAPHGVDPVFHPGQDPSEVLHNLGVRGEYLVALGGAARRNLSVAIDTWRELVRRGADLSLIVVGPEAPPPPPVSGLFWAGPVDDLAWAALLAGSTAFLYPTEYEGFGMPGLEALATGAPVVATRTSSLPEVLGQAGLWATSLDARDLADALEPLLSDPELSVQARKRATRQAASRTGWEYSAAQHLRAYQMASDV